MAQVGKNDFADVMGFKVSIKITVAHFVEGNIFQHGFKVGLV